MYQVYHFKIMENINFTNKAQKTVMQAQNLASDMGRQDIDALHLLFAILSDNDSIVFTLLNKLNVDTEDLQKKVRSALSQIPTASNNSRPMGQFYLTQDMDKVINGAKDEAINMGDEFVSLRASILITFKYKQFSWRYSTKSYLFKNCGRRRAERKTRLFLSPESIWSN